MYAKIILSLLNKDVDREFTYKIPMNMKEKIKIGIRVLVPFGANNKLSEGFVVGLSENIDFDESKLKDINNVLDEEEIISKELLDLAYWMKNKYYTTLSRCIKTIIPRGLNVKSDFILELLVKFETGSLSKKQLQIIDHLKNNGSKILLSELENDLSNVSTDINKLINLDIVRKTSFSEVKNLNLLVSHVYINYDNENIHEIIKSAKDKINKKDKKQKEVIKFLVDNDGLSLNDIKTYLNITASPIKTLEKKEIVKIIKKEVLRNPIIYTKEKNISEVILTENQKIVVNDIINLKSKKPVLLHGITGSGKTEVYIKLTEEAIKAGKQAIVLVPEISLTSQIVDIFVKRFGGIISLTHSRLSIGERYDQWKRALKGEISIMIGTRSALFAPFKNLGLIVIDEEHENSYKGDTTPKYSAIEVGIKRAEISKSTIVLGSATPSIESYFKAENKEYHLLKITERINKTIPDIIIIDMRKELELGNRSIFSRELLYSIDETLKNKEQVILFLNRRGHSTFVSCRKCGSVLKCDKCNVNYTYHSYSNKVMCHYCGEYKNNPNNCPICGSKYIKYFGIGTQKVEDEIKKYFTKTNIIRMDMDTTVGKHSHKNILNQFSRGEAEILIGTQMIAKGLDFPRVTLVGVIAADLTLNVGDFRAGEITYQLLTQVSGRAGRSYLKGKVYIQTYNPEHYSIVCAKGNNYEEFYKHEISLRRQMNYPPYTKVFIVLFTTENEENLIKQLFNLLNIMNLYNKKKLFEIIGPAPANISKIKNNYRWKIIIKGVDEEKLKNFTIYCLEKLKKENNLMDIIVNISLNPSYIP